MSAAISQTQVVPSAIASWSGTWNYHLYFPLRVSIYVLHRPRVEVWALFNVTSVVFLLRHRITSIIVILIAVLWTHVRLLMNLLDRSAQNWTRGSGHAPHSDRVEQAHRLPCCSLFLWTLMTHEPTTCYLAHPPSFSHVLVFSCGAALWYNEDCFGVKQTWVQTSALPLSSLQFSVSVPQFPKGKKGGESFLIPPDLVSNLYFVSKCRILHCLHWI